MSLMQLRTFIEVYRRRSISTAARVLNLTQPAVSQHIASLEAQLGRPLFERHSRGVRPTIAGDDLAAAIGDTLDQAEGALAAARARSIQLTGTVHLAGPADYLSEVIAPRLTPLLDAGLRLRLQLGGKEAIYAMLLNDQVQLAITASQPADDRLQSIQIDQERLVAVAAPELAERITARDLQTGLRSTPLLAYDSEKPLIRAWLASNRLEAAELPAVTAADFRLLRSMLCAGMGWSVFPDYLVASQIEAGQLKEIPAPVAVPVNGLYIAWSKSALRHPRIAFARTKILEIVGA